MGLFASKITAKQMEFVQITLTQLNDSSKLINNTVKPDVFFKRLHFALDLLLRLQPYEKYRVFKGSSPTRDYNQIIANLEKTVDSFIDRAINANEQKMASLKTEAARQRNQEKFVVSLISAFDCAHTFWQGDRAFPHYTGPLFTPNNYRRVLAIYNKMDGH